MIVKSCYFARFIDNEDVVKEFTENLNCTIRHRFKPAEGSVAYTIEDATGNKSVLIVAPQKIRGMVKSEGGLRIVVDNIQEGIEFFKSKGYEILLPTVETESNFGCAMINQRGELRLVFEHKKH